MSKAFDPPQRRARWAPDGHTIAAESLTIHGLDAQFEHRYFPLRSYLALKITMCVQYKEQATNSFEPPRCRYTSTDQVPAVNVRHKQNEAANDWSPYFRRYRVLALREEPDATGVPLVGAGLQVTDFLTFLRGESSSCRAGFPFLLLPRGGLNCSTVRHEDLVWYKVKWTTYPRLESTCVVRFDRRQWYTFPRL